MWKAVVLVGILSFGVLFAQDSLGVRLVRRVELSRSPNSIADGENFLFALVNDTIKVIDFREPESASVVLSIPVNFGPSSEILVRTNYAYVATDSGLAIFDITNPLYTRRIATVRTSQPLGGIAASGTFIHLITKYSDAYIFNVYNPLSALEVSSYSLGDETDSLLDISLYSGYAYITSTSGKIFVVDIADPYNPDLLVWIATGIYSRSIFTANNTAFIASRFDGLHIVDISDARYPTEVGYYESVDARSVKIARDIALLADGDGGLKVVDISVRSNPILIGYYRRNLLADALAVKNCYAILGNEALNSIDIFYIAPLVNVDENTDSRPVNTGILAYPNPFNSGCKIRLPVERSGKATFEIYNIYGHVVETLFNGTVGAQSIELKWTPGSLPPGVYFGKLKTDKHEKTLKLIYLK